MRWFSFSKFMTVWWSVSFLRTKNKVLRNWPCTCLVGTILIAFLFKISRICWFTETVTVLGLFIEKVLKKKGGEGGFRSLGLPLKLMVRFLISPNFSENAEIVQLVESFPDFPELASFFIKGWTWGNNSGARVSNHHPLHLSLIDFEAEG